MCVWLFPGPLLHGDPVAGVRARTVVHRLRLGCPRRALEEPWLAVQRLGAWFSRSDRCVVEQGLARIDAVDGAQEGDVDGREDDGDEQPVGELAEGSDRASTQLGVVDLDQGVRGLYGVASTV